MAEISPFEEVRRLKQQRMLSTTSLTPSPYAEIQALRNAKATPDLAPKVNTLSDLGADPEALTAIEAYYKKRGFVWDDTDDLLDTYAWDMRKRDMNSVSMGSTLMEINKAKDENDVDTLLQLKTMRSKWRDKATLIGETQQDPLGAAEGLVENVLAGLFDPTSLAYGFTGGAGKVAQFGAAVALDASINAAFNVATQKQEQSLGMRVEGPLDLEEVGIAGALGTVPGLTISTAKGLYGLGKTVKQHYRPTKELAEKYPIDAPAMDHIKEKTDAPKFTKNIVFQDKETGESMYTFAKSSDINEEIVDAAGNPIIFRNEEAAADYARTTFGKPELTPDILREVSKNDSVNTTGWQIVEKGFADKKEGAEFIKKHGASIGSTNPKDFVAYNRGGLKLADTPGASSIMHAIRLSLQMHADDLLGRRKMVTDTKARIQKRIDADPEGEHAPRLKAMLAEDPYTVAVNAQNAKFDAFSFQAIKPFALRTDADGSRYVEDLETEKSLVEIKKAVVDAFAAKGIDDKITPVKEFGMFILGSRAEALEMSGKQTGFKLDELARTMASIRNDPVRLQIYEAAAADLRRFDMALLKLAHDLDMVSTAKMTQTIEDNAHYLPISRLYDGTYIRHSEDKGMKADTLKKAVGSQDKPEGQNFLDPFEAYSQQVEAIISGGYLNRSKKATYQWIQALGGYGHQYAVHKQAYKSKKRQFTVREVERALEKKLGKDNVHIQVTEKNKDSIALSVREALITKPTEDFYYDKGVLQFVEIKDELLYDSMKATGPSVQEALNLAVHGHSMGAKALNGWRWLQEQQAKFIVNDPALNTFKFLPNDAVFSWIFKAHSSIRELILDLPFLNVARGLSKSTTSKEYREFMHLGGMAGLRSQTTNFSDNLMAHAKKHGIDPDSVMGLGVEKDVGLARKMLNATFGNLGLSSWGQRTENVVRYSNYLTARQVGHNRANAAVIATEAANDWRRHGSSQASTQVQRAMGLFFRARVNSLYQRGRMVFAADRGQGARLQRLAKLATITVGVPMVYEALTDDDDRIQSMSSFAKDNYAIIPIPGMDEEGGLEFGKGGYISLPKYNEEWFAGNAIRRLKEEWKKSEEGRATWKLMRQWILGTVFNAMGLDDPLATVLPPPVTALIQVNTGLRGNSKITRQSEEGQSAHLQGELPDVKSYTLNRKEFHDALREFNHLFQVELNSEEAGILMRGLLATVAKYTLDTTDYYYKQKDGVYGFNYYDLPMVREIYKPDRPQRFTSYEDKLFEWQDRLTKIANDINAIENKGKIDNIEDVERRLNEDPTKYAKYLAATKEVKKAVAQRQKDMAVIMELYATQKGRMNMEDLEKTVDKLFKARNEKLKGAVTVIEGILEKEKKTELKEETDNALSRTTSK